MKNKQTNEPERLGVERREALGGMELWTSGGGGGGGAVLSIRVLLILIRGNAAVVVTTIGV